MQVKETGPVTIANGQQTDVLATVTFGGATFTLPDPIKSGERVTFFHLNTPPPTGLGHDKDWALVNTTHFYCKVDGVWVLCHPKPEGQVPCDLGNCPECGTPLMWSQSPLRVNGFCPECLVQENEPETGLNLAVASAGALTAAILFAIWDMIWRVF